MSIRFLPLCLACALAVTAFAVSPVSAQPSHTTYQGSLFKDGNAYTGSANFKFAIIDGGVTLWSNDGTSVAGSEPAASVVLSVDQGIFTAFLGQGMDSLSADELAGSAAPVLRVWVDTGAGFDQLSDQTISSSAFALRSDSAERSLGGFVANGLIHSTSGGVMFPDSTVQTTAGGLAAGSANETLRNDGVDWVPSSAILTDGTNVGIGVAPTSGRQLNVVSTTNYGVFGSSSHSSGRGLYGFSSHTTGQVYGVAGSSSSNNSSGAGVYGVGYRGIRGYSSWTGSAMGVYGEAANTGTYTNYGGYFYARGYYGRGVYGVSSGTLGRAVYGYASNTSSSNYGGYFQSQGASGRGVYGRASSVSSTTYGVFGSAEGNGYALYADGRLRAQTDFSNSDAIHTLNSTVNLSLADTLFSMTVPDSSDTASTFLSMTRGTDTEFSVSGNGTVRADGNVYAAAHLTGGADFAEMLPGDAGLGPGDVLTIGSDGQLTRSTQAIQSSVVGIYSTKPGFVGGAGSEEEMLGKIPLAIVGIVPVKVSAENGPIQPGDLLVTSKIPGHAMRHDGPPPGTIVGKALEGLSGETGVIKMLVTLQ